MKETTKMSRLTGQLESLFNKINQDWFGGQLEPVIITVSPSANSYGHYTLGDTWQVKGEGRREINIASATIDRPIENTVATMMHEMCHHYNDTVLHRQDCSRSNTYHNKVFKASAEEHGLIVTRSDKYGWSHTEPSDELLLWILKNDIQDIKLSRMPESLYWMSGGNSTRGGTLPPTKPKGSNSRRYCCPNCGNIARTTKLMNLICGDCLVEMLAS